MVIHHAIDNSEVLTTQWNTDSQQVRHNSKTSRGTLKKGSLPDALVASEGAQARLFLWTPDGQHTPAHVFHNDAEEECKHLVHHQWNHMSFGKLEAMAKCKQLSKGALKKDSLPDALADSERA